MYSVELAAVEVDIPDDRRARSWLTTYVRKILLRRYRQEAIYVRLIGPIEVETVTVD